jgi:hypothetical protein
VIAAFVLAVAGQIGPSYFKIVEHLIDIGKNVAMLLTRQLGDVDRRLRLVAQIVDRASRTLGRSSHSTASGKPSAAIVFWMLR